MECKVNTFNPNIALLSEAAQMQSTTTMYLSLEQVFMGCYLMLLYYPQMIISPDGQYYWDYQKQKWVGLPNKNWFIYFLLGFITATLLENFIVWATQ